MCSTFSPQPSKKPLRSADARKAPSYAQGQTLTDLRATFARAGRLEWIGLRPGPRRIESVFRVELAVHRGLVGDHRAVRAGGKRQVTLIQFEHLAVVAALCGLDAVSASLLRRNLAVSGVNLLALHDRHFRIGAALLEGTGLCHPCSRMEEGLGPGGYNAMRGHGGITARVLEGGMVQVGDLVAAEDLLPS